MRTDIYKAIKSGRTLFAVIMQMTSSSSTPVGCVPACANLVAGRCTPRVHAAMAGMLAVAPRECAPGRLFAPGAYPLFENGRGARYVREYLPLHLPQLEYGLEQAFPTVCDAHQSPGRPIRVLDVGSGPASVPMALDRLVSAGRIAGSFEVQPIEQSAEFCSMLRIAGESLRSGQVVIREPRQMTLEQYISQPDAAGLYACDWVVMGNVLSPLAHGKSPADYSGLIRRLMERHMTMAGSPVLTAIEGSCSTYVQPYPFMRELAAQFTLVREVGLSHSVQLDRPAIRNCAYYRGPYQGCKPRIIMVTVRKAAA